MKSMHILFLLSLSMSSIFTGKSYKGFESYEEYEKTRQALVIAVDAEDQCGALKIFIKFVKNGCFIDNAIGYIKLVNFHKQEVQNLSLELLIIVFKYRTTKAAPRQLKKPLQLPQTLQKQISQYEKYLMPKTSSIKPFKNGYATKQLFNIAENAIFQTDVFSLSHTWWVDTDPFLQSAGLKLLTKFVKNGGSSIFFQEHYYLVTETLLIATIICCVSNVYFVQEAAIDLFTALVNKHCKGIKTAQKIADHILSQSTKFSKNVLSKAEILQILIKEKSNFN